uniref:LAM_G_DOMAIN domain-containing protein n=1 Tax=Heligmosomoides polygyrus TaxID=6339 RepID=A0A183G818_HELPZ
LDLSVPCFRFLDVYSGIFLGGRPALSGKVEQGFSGCIANLTLNDELVEFSSLAEMDVRGSVREGCAHRRDFCSSGACSPNAKCISRWNGVNCRCPHSTHHNGSCTAELSSVHRRPLTLTDDESFVIYRPPNVSVPFTLSFEFRTSRHDVQIIVAEFKQRNTFFKLEVDDGLMKAWLGLSSSMIEAPELHSGTWTRVDVEFREEEVQTTVDGIYSVTSKHSMFDKTLDVLYAGLAPSTGHPSRFDGCLRDVAINAVTLPIDEKGKDLSATRAGQCARCKAFALRTDSASPPTPREDTTAIVKAVCLVGTNCERSAAIQICPHGFWGRFPHCEKCVCAEGFQTQCDKNNGECLCPKFQFPLHGRCVSCECGYGATSLQCSVDGQCQCSGQASGRRCDRCVLDHHVS